PPHLAHPVAGFGESHMAVTHHHYGQPHHRRRHVSVVCAETRPTNRAHRLVSDFNGPVHRVFDKTLPGLLVDTSDSTRLCLRGGLQQLDDPLSRSSYSNPRQLSP